MTLAKTFTAYFDASGDRARGGTVTMCGLVATAHKWRKFETEWLALLERFGLTPPFHTTDFERGRGQYRGLGRDDAEREASRRDNAAREATRGAFRVEALGIMHRHTSKWFTVSVVVEALRRAYHEYEMPSSEYGRPYVWCGVRSYDLVRQWMQNRSTDSRGHPRDRIAFVFEEGDDDQQRLEEVLRRDMMLPTESIHFVPKADAVPLQACDFLAWEMRYETERRQDPSSGARAERPTIGQVARLHAPDSAVYADWRTFVAHCEWRGYPKQSEP